VQIRDSAIAFNTCQNKIVGESNRGRLLIGSYTERRESIRIISAREVTKSEREAYEEG
jgi:uncharacterized protein